MAPLSQPSSAFNSDVYVEQMCQILALNIPPEIWPSVVENFEQILAIAQPVLDFELPDDLEPAPTFDP
ncbi:MAG TPA: DUF4089 domain-containing protein [Candidatus Obscuribacterales bacterium]